MESVTIQCPSCSQPLLVPSEMAGKVVRCPSCRMTFPTGPNGQATVTPQAPPPLPFKTVWRPEEKPSRYPPLAPREGSQGRDFDDDDIDLDCRSRNRRRGRDFDDDDDPVGRLTLRVRREEVQGRVNAPAVSLIFIGVLQLFVFGAFVVAAMRNRRFNEEATFQMILGAVALVFSVFIISGGASMKSLRSYGMARAAAILAIIPCTLCFFAMPIGIWALFVLSDPEVRRAFDR